MSPKSSDSSRSPQGPQLRSHSKSGSRSYPPVTSVPQQRRLTIQPKSTRQQFSACGACRMRRVRCDLKDLQALNPEAGHTSCSNCKERGLNCVDEFADVKAVKLLRRGRRLQQVEAVYGKASPEDDRPTYSSTSRSSIIPQIKAEFFSSHFFRRLLIQHPILEPTEFTCRYFASLKGNSDALGVAGVLICKVLVAWAASFGVNEYGEEESQGGPAAIRHRKDLTNDMVLELLSLVDSHALLRKPSWDGVRFLLLLLPLTEIIQPPMDRLTMYEATINQTYTLCSLASATSVNSGQGEYTDALVRMNIFNYAYVHEGLTTGLRGGRLHLSDDDLASFQNTLPATNNTNSPPPPAMPFILAHRYAKAPLRLSYVCRQVHRALTGPRARQMNVIDEGRLKDSWESLDSLWEEFENLRHSGMPTSFMHPEEVERFVNGWQIVIFECQNVIREALKHRLVEMNDRSPSGGDNSRSNYSQISQLHTISEAKCRDGARRVAGIIRRTFSQNYSQQSSSLVLFQFDGCLVRDGVYFAGFLLASEPSLGREGDLEYCLSALREMRWGFSKSEEREYSLTTMWESRTTQAVQQLHGRATDFQVHSEDEISVNIAPPSPYRDDLSPTTGRRLLRPQLPPPISIMNNAGGMIIDSAPNTASSMQENGGWTTMNTSSSSLSGIHGLAQRNSHHSANSSAASTPPRYSPPNHQLTTSHPHLNLPNTKTEVMHSGLLLNVNDAPNIMSSTTEMLHSPRSGMSSYSMHDIHTFSYSSDPGGPILPHPDSLSQLPSTTSSTMSNISHPSSPAFNHPYFDSSAAAAFPSPSPTSDGSGGVPSPSFAHFGSSSFYVN